MKSPATAQKNSTAADSLKGLQSVRTHTGSWNSFWDVCIESMVKTSQALMALVITRRKVAGSNWQVIHFHPKDRQFEEYARALKDAVPEAVEACGDSGRATLLVPNGRVAALHVEGEDGENAYLGLFHLGDIDEDMADEKLEILASLSDLPAGFRFRKAADRAIFAQDQFGKTLDLLVLMNEKEKYLSAAMTFCNEMAARHGCDRAALGWGKKGYVKLQALSHSDNFEKKMEAAQKLEAAMEEAYDQNIEILIPPHKSDSAVHREHAEYSQIHNLKHICSLPLRLNGETLGVLTLERNSAPFEGNEIRGMRLACDHAVRRLKELKDNDKWFGALMAAKLRQSLGKLVGFENTWMKALGIALALGLAFACFVPLPFRIEAAAIVRTDHVNYLTAPFEGHIDKVYARVGDVVRDSQDLMQMDISDLLLEEASALAEKTRHQREAEKARAGEALAEMQIAQAMYDQADARLELVRYKLERATVKAPYAGVIVEGDLLEKTGAPVRQGDVLFKIARIDSMYAVLEVGERDIHLVSLDQTGELALTSNPDKKFPLRVFRQEPAAVVKQEGNVFLVHAALGASPDWIRPGMTGVAKLNRGRKPLIWIVSRKTVDFLRMKLWW